LGGESVKDADYLEWCKGQPKGLRLVRPSEAVCASYFAKAESALNMLAAAREKDEPDWIVTTAYYAKYFSLYAIFAKCGVKCEVHSCTLAAAKAVLVGRGLMPKDLFDGLNEAKDLRTDMQYYVYDNYDRDAVSRQAMTAPGFVLAMRTLADALDPKAIGSIRAALDERERGGG
jgi:uncharacterized protein (UPF0332 family)